MSEDICQKVAKGVGSIEDVCLSVGIGLSTFFDWQKQYPDFSEALLKARAERRIRWEKKLETAGDDDWRALARLMEVTEPKRYAPRVRVHVEEELTDALNRIQRRLPPSVYEQVLSAIAAEDRSPETGSAEEPEGSGDDNPVETVPAP